MRTTKQSKTIVTESHLDFNFFFENRVNGYGAQRLKTKGCAAATWARAHGPVGL